MRMMILSLLVFLTGCAANVREGVIVEKNVFLDKNIPKLHLEFPFNLSKYTVERGIDYGDGLNSIGVDYRYYKITTEKNRDLVIISKQGLRTDGRFSYFSGTDDSKIKNKIFYKKNKLGYCLLNHEKINENEYLIANVMKYSGNKYLTSVKIYRNLGVDYDASKLKNENKNIADEYISYTDSICSQMFR